MHKDEDLGGGGVENEPLSPGMAHFRKVMQPRIGLLGVAYHGGMMIHKGPPTRCRTSPVIAL